MLHLAVLIQYRRVTDRRTHDDSIYRVSTASCSKNSVSNAGMAEPSPFLALLAAQNISGDRFWAVKTWLYLVHAAPLAV